MTDNNDDRHDKDPAGSGFGTPSPGSWPRKEPVLDGFDDEETLEEPDRDNDYNTLYSEAEEEELELFEESSEQGDDLFAPGDDSDEEPWEDEEPDGAEHPWPTPTDASELQGGVAASAWSGTAAAAGIDNEPLTPDDLDEEWEDEDYEEPAAQSTWPLGMIAVAVLALVLLAAGGYGVMEQRTAMQEEIRQLRASLATSADPEEVAASREAVAATEQRNAELQAQVDSLALENRQLRDTVAGLEAQLTAQQEALARASAAPPAAAPPKPAAATPEPAAQTRPAPAPKAASENWFVNFGSYSQQATAESWAKRLKTGSGDVVVTTGNRDGRTFYRVRVVSLPNKATANQVARKLEQEYRLERLWVGRQ